MIPSLIHSSLKVQTKQMPPCSTDTRIKLSSRHIGQNSCCVEALEARHSFQDARQSPTQLARSQGPPWSSQWPLLCPDLCWWLSLGCGTVLCDQVSPQFESIFLGKYLRHFLVNKMQDLLNFILYDLSFLTLSKFTSRFKSPMSRMRKLQQIPGLNPKPLKKLVFWKPLTLYPKP